MKNNLNKFIKLIKETFWALLVSLFCVSGWVMYIYSEINHDSEDTKRINANTVAMIDSINRININKKVDTQTITQTKHVVPDDIWEYIDELLAINKTLRDSVVYYSGFYKLVMEKHPYNYEASFKDSGEYRIVERKLSMDVEQIIQNKDTFFRFRKRTEENLELSEPRDSIDSI